MGLRTRLVFALALVAIVPVAAIAWRTGPVFADVGERLADSASDRARGVVTERLADVEASLRRDLDALADELDSLEADVRTLLEEEGGLLTRRRRRALQEVAEARAAERGVDGAVIAAHATLEPRVSLSPALSGVPEAWPAPGRALWQWSEHGDRLVVRVVLGPLPRRGLFLAGERAVERGALERLAERATDGRVTLRAWRRGADAAAGGRRARIGVDGRVVPFDRPLDVAPLGTMTFALPDGHAPLAALRAELLRVAALSLAVAILGGLLLAGLLSRPLRRLTRSVSAVADGEPPPGAMPGGHGEVGRLASAVDRMLAAIATEHRGRLAAERRGAWREIAQRVAHEVRNPLSPIRLAVSNIRRARERRGEPGDDGLGQELAAIETEVSRLDRLVSEFAEYARLPAPRPVECALADVVIPAVRGQVPDDGRVVVDIVGEPGPPARAAVDADLLGQVFANLAKNAVEALGPAGGRLRVSLRGLARRGGAIVVLEDDGPGIPEEVGERLFEPYVTGRGEAGTGLGLALTRRIVDEHGGTIEADRSPLGGARFTIHLPAGGRRPEES